MRQLLGLLVLLAACDGKNPSSHDAGDARDAGDAHDAGRHDASVDPEFRALVVELLAEYDREAMAKCPCQVAHGDFASIEVCIEKIGSRSESADCVTAALSGADNAAALAAIPCQVDKLKQGNACLESSSCAQEELDVCIQEKLGCPMLDPQVLTRLLAKCPDLSLLSR